MVTWIVNRWKRVRRHINYLYPWFRESDPQSKFLSHEYVRVMSLRKCSLQFVQLRRSETCPVPLLLHRLLRVSSSTSSVVRTTGRCHRTTAADDTGPRWSTRWWWLRIDDGACPTETTTTTTTTCSSSWIDRVKVADATCWATTYVISCWSEIVVCSRVLLLMLMLVVVMMRVVAVVVIGCIGMMKLKLMGVVIVFKTAAVLVDVMTWVKVS